MRNFYLILSFVFFVHNIKAQCPVINGAMIKPCVNSAGEGINEFVFFTTTEAGTAGDYIMYYGSGNPPKTAPTGTLSGANAAAKTGPGSVIASGGCNVIHVTSPTTAIPANSRVVFIPKVLDQQYDVAGICTSGNIYVVYIDINLAPSNNWIANGTLANSPSANRYIQITKGSNNCTGNIRTYQNSWPSSEAGNAISWNDAGIATYHNNGCVFVVTPVKLLSFNVAGVGSNAQVYWKTTTEMNTQKFEVERSVDGTLFKTINVLPAAGQSNETRSYLFTDINIPIGTMYYRLKMVDRDGSFSYSPIAKISNSRNSFEITNIYPRPSHNNINIAWNAPKAGTTNTLVFDVTGRLLIQQKSPTYYGMNSTNIDISALPAGQYLLRMEKEGLVKTMSFSKQ